MKNKRMFILDTLVLVIMFICAFGNILDRAPQMRTYHSYTGQAMAHVTGMEIENHYRQRNVKLDYIYEAGGQSHAKESGWMGIVDNMETGTDAVVRFDENHPENSMLYVEYEDNLKKTVIMSGIILFAVIGEICVVMMQR